MNEWVDLGTQDTADMSCDHSTALEFQAGPAYIRMSQDGPPDGAPPQGHSGPVSTWSLQVAPPSLAYVITEGGVREV